MPTGLAHERSWRATLMLYCRPEMLTMLFLGFSSGLPFLLLFSTLFARLRMSGVEVATIGYFSWIGVIYSIKFLWAPVVDRLQLPLLSRLLGHRRSWLIVAQLGILAGLAALALLNPNDHLGALVAITLAVAFAAATQDITIDAYRIESASDDLQAAMASIYVIGYRGGLLVAGAGALALAGRYSWQMAYLCMAALMLVGLMTVLVRPEPARSPTRAAILQEPRVRAFIRSSQGMKKPMRRLIVWIIGAVVCPFTDFFSRYGLRAFALLAFIGVFRISDLSMAAMANPLYIDLGFTTEQIGVVSGIFGVFMTLLGGLIGGALAGRYGIRPLLWLAAIAIALANLLFSALALSGHSLIMMIVTITADNLAGGVASALFIAFLSGLTSRAYTATQYALFSSIMTLPGKLIGGFSGAIVDSIGYPRFFVIVALLSIPAVLLALWIWRDPGFHHNIEDQKG
ncbi:AmpG family muropeptide MFS transporter [Carnimonas nigrificans]|uniref:AmpG family muropeptide MFS transporter n=1 Tax=Carnimonas nigrificans TaxID=64323 RepID=UPI0004714336|nr:MFS transporter [Carnimonas nigrificans]